MSYNANSLVKIGNKNCYILLDHYGQKSKNNLNIATTGSNFAFFTGNTDITAVRKIHTKEPVFGFWHLLYHNNVIDLEDEKGGFVFLKEETDKGFYLFYDRQKSEAITGVVIKGKPIGAFAYNVADAVLVEVDTSELKLPKESILLPAELQKRRVQEMQKEGLKNLVVTVGILAGAFFFNLSLTSLASEKSELNQALQKVKHENRQVQDKLASLKKVRYEVKKIADIPEMLAPLFVIAHASPEVLQIKSMPLKSRSFSFLVKDGARPWMNGLLESNLFTLTELRKSITNFADAKRNQKNKIKIEWRAK
jgi:hypothetical protein